MTKISRNKIIEVNNLTKRYKKAKEDSVNDVSFYVEEGAFFSLLGPNGAGKTTIVSILTTLLNPTTGKVNIAGFDITKKSSDVRQNIGVIFQKPSLDKNLTAEENIRFHANLYGLFTYKPSFQLMPKEYQQRVESLSDILGIKDSLHSPVKNLSGGMMRKLEIVRSLMHHPRVLFLDEPTTGLDPASRRNLWQYLKKMREDENITIFLTTHYLEEAEGSDYICIIDHGKIVNQGRPNEIKEALVEKYLLVDSVDKNKLISALNRLKLDYSGKGPFRVSPNHKTFQEIIAQLPELSTLEIHNPTLEDAYLEIIKQ